MAAWNLINGFSSSALENAVYEEVFGVATASTVSLFAQAALQGAEMLQLDSSTIERDIGGLQASDDLKDSIAASVRAGRRIIISRDVVALGDWRGWAWLDYDPDTGDGGFMVETLAGAWTADYEKWYSTGIGACVDLPRTSFYQDASVFGRWRSKVTGRFMTDAYGRLLNTLLDTLSLVVMPLVFAFEQALGDINDPKLSTDQRAERALMTWIVFEAEAIAAMAFVIPWAMGVGTVVGGPYGGAAAAAMACALLSVAVSVMWDMVKDTVFDYYGQGSSQACAPSPRRGQIACA